jgi:uncharacterized Zn-binding protein involved in type VI secretion
MPRVIKDGDLSQGHCWPPTVPAIVDPSRNVFIGGRRVVILGDLYLPHPGPCGVLPPHPVATAAASNGVFIQGRPVVRDGDFLNCGDVANALEGTVFADGGGLGGPAATTTGDPGQTTGFSAKVPRLDYPVNVVDIRMIFNPAINNLVGTCPNQTIDLSPTVFTPLEEEITGNLFQNFPGPPLSVQSGGVNLPQYAPQSARLPVAIDPIMIVGGILPAGLSLNPNSGRINGTLAPQPVIGTGFVVRFQTSNFVGAGNVFTINFRYVPVIRC